MDEHRMAARHALRVEWYLWAVLAAWAGVVALSGMWNARQVKRDTLELARLQARVGYQKDVVYRRWNTNRGALYVAESKDTPPNPYLAGVPERDIVTPSGRRLTRVNPAYMTRQVHEMTEDESGVRGHITSLNPIRPGNAADPWETKALKAVASGQAEVSSVETMDGRDYMRLLRPLVTEPGCLKCHAGQGYRVGDIRGGISVSIPMDPLWAVGRNHMFTLTVGHLLVWLVGVGGIVVGGQRLRASRDAIEMRNLQLKRARQEAEEANQAKGAFLANMSHELRTPMNAILGYSEMLMEEAEDLEQEGFIPDLERIHGAGRHLLALINDILDLSKIEAGKMELYLETFDLAQMTDEIRSTVDTLVRKKGNTLVLECDDDLGSMYADLTKVRQSLFNLISNAAKFTENGTITLSAQREEVPDGDRIVFSVADTGIGIAEQNLDKLFGEFTQADASTTRKYGGTGLGLAITKRFCQMMGGDIDVESVLGEGSTFTIRLPAEVTPATSEGAETEVEEKVAESAEAAVSGQGLAPDRRRTILVIDDDPGVRDLLQRFLVRNGFEVATAPSGEEGVRLAREVQPAAITLDVMMPHMDGWAVLKALKADPGLSDIPVIMLTMVDDRSMGYTLGAAEYMTKPVDAKRLVKTLKRYQKGPAPPSVLVVEDDRETRQIMRRTLEKEGWEVAEAENGKVALGLMAERAPSLIVLDLIMPVMDGFEFAMEVRKVDEWRDIPVVVVTAKDITEEERQRLNGGVLAILNKGAYSREDLLGRVRDMIVKHAASTGSPAAADRETQR